MAAFLAALQALDGTDGPQPGIHNWFRGGTLRTYDNDTQRALKDLQGHIDVDLAGGVWADALSAPWDGVDRWFHGDIAEGNLLLDDAGQLTAVRLGPAHSTRSNRRTHASAAKRSVMPR